MNKRPFLLTALAVLLATSSASAENLRNSRLRRLAARNAEAPSGSSSTEASVQPDGHGAAWSTETTINTANGSESGKEVSANGTIEAQKTANGITTTSHSTATGSHATFTQSGTKSISRTESGLASNGTSTVTGPNGHSENIASTGTASKMENGIAYSNEKTGTNPNGVESYHSETDGSVTRNGGGSLSYEQEKSVTTKGGKTYAVDKSGTITATGSGVQVNGTNTYTSASGRQAVGTVQASAVRNGSNGVSWNSARELSSAHAKGNLTASGSASRSGSGTMHTERTTTSRSVSAKSGGKRPGR